MPKPNSVKQPLSTVSPEEAAWAAGFIEGEGTIVVRARPDWRKVLLVATQAEPGVACLYELQRLFGGSVYPLGVNWEARRSFKGNYPMWHWDVSSQALICRALKLMTPYFHHPQKRCKAMLAIKAIERSILTHKRKWTPEEDEYVRTHYRHGTAERIAKTLGRSIQAVQSRTVALGATDRKYQRQPKKVETPSSDAPATPRIQ